MTCDYWFICIGEREGEGEEGDEGRGEWYVRGVECRGSRRAADGTRIMTEIKGTRKMGRWLMGEKDWRHRDKIGERLAKGKGWEYSRGQKKGNTGVGGRWLGGCV